MRQRFATATRSFIYFLLSTVIFLSVCDVVGVEIRYAVCLVVVLWAAAEIIIRGDLEKAAPMFKMALMFSVPYLLIWLLSTVVWLRDLMDASYVERGSRNIIYMLINIFFCSASYYLLGKRCLYLLFYGMCIANGFVIMRAALSYGPAAFFSEYIDLVISFAGRTGEGIMTVEIHDIVFGWSVFVIFYLMDNGKKRIRFLHLVVTLFFFLAAFKRIGVLAVAAATLVGLIYHRLPDRLKKRSVIVITAAFAVVSFTYLVLIKNHLFLSLLGSSGVDSSGRDWIFYTFDDFYELDPTFLGNGIRFIYQYGELNNVWNSQHNVYLEMYIESGFIMYFVFIAYELCIRPLWIAKRYGWKSTSFLIAGSVFMFITFFSDNTSYQPPANIIYRLLAMVWAFEYKIPVAVQKPPLPQLMR